MNLLTGLDPEAAQRPLTWAGDAGEPEECGML